MVISWGWEGSDQKIIPGRGNLLFPDLAIVTQLFISLNIKNTSLCTFLYVYFVIKHDERLIPNTFLSRV